MPDVDDFLTSLRRHADPAWDADRFAAFAVLMGMAFELGLGEGGVEEAVEQATAAIEQASAEEIEALLSEDERDEEPETQENA